MRQRPHAVALDVIETLVSLEPLRPRLVELGLPEHTLELWFSRVLRDGFALAAAGDFRPFADIARWTLRELAGPGDPSGDDAEAVLASLAELPLHPDAEPALRRLSDAGIRIYPLTNGAAGGTRRLLERGGVLDLVSGVISVDEVGTWKPAPAPYLHAAMIAAVEPERMALVAAHPWDIHGAARAGLSTGFVSRAGAVIPPGMRQPTVAGADLVEVMALLLALPAGS